MTRKLPEHDAGSDWIQFRGFQTSVVLDQFGLRFTTEKRSTPDGQPNLLAHKPLPVASRDAIQQGEAPDDAVPLEVAEAITDGDLSNPLICWGVVCEHPVPDADHGVCGEVFDTPDALNGHLANHYNDSEADADADQADGESE